MTEHAHYAKSACVSRFAILYIFIVTKAQVATWNLLPLLNEAFLRFKTRAERPSESRERRCQSWDKPGPGKSLSSRVDEQLLIPGRTGKCDRDLNDPLPDVTVGSVGIPKPASLSAVLPNKGRDVMDVIMLNRPECILIPAHTLMQRKSRHTTCALAQEHFSRPRKANLCFYGK